MSDKKTKTFVYQNISQVRQAVIGIGVVSPGSTVELPHELDNPNFELINKSDKVKKESNLSNKENK